MAPSSTADQGDNEGGLCSGPAVLGSAPTDAQHSRTEEGLYGPRGAALHLGSYHSATLLCARMTEVSMSMGWYRMPLSSRVSSRDPTTYSASCRPVNSVCLHVPRKPRHAEAWARILSPTRGSQAQGGLSSNIMRSHTTCREGDGGTGSAGCYLCSMEPPQESYSKCKRVIKNNFYLWERDTIYRSYQKFCLIWPACGGCTESSGHWPQL